VKGIHRRSYQRPIGFDGYVVCVRLDLVDDQVAHRTGRDEQSSGDCARYSSAYAPGQIWVNVEVVH
jgi:hypothetical protein